VFGKQDTDVINLSAIVAGTGGFVINGGLDQLDKPPQSNHLRHHHSHHLHWRLSSHSILLLAQVVLLSMVSQRVIGVVAQSFTLLTTAGVVNPMALL
jgi:Ca2+/H+ antiporter